MTFSHDETRGLQQSELGAAQRDQEAVRLYEEGLSPREVGLRLSLSSQTGYRLLSKSGVARRGPGGHRRCPSDHLTEREQEAVQRSADGESAREIAQRLGVTTYRVYRALRFVGIRPRRGRPSPSPEMQQRAQEFAHLYVEEGLSLREVGACFGVSGERVRQILKRAGVGRRSSRGRDSRDQPIERSADAVHLYVEGGLTLAEIAARLEVSSLTLARILEKAGVPRRRGSSALTRSQLAQRTEQIVRLSLEEGLTQKEVGARLGVSGATVCRTLVGMGVKVSGRRAEQRVQRNEGMGRG